MSEIIYEGLGFPIIVDVEMFEFGGERHPIVDVRKVADFAMRTLGAQEDMLTGNQLLFIRTYLDKSPVEFAKELKVTEQDINKWEDLSDEPTGMDAKVEASLKQYMQSEMRNNENKKSLLGEKGFFSSSQKEAPKTPGNEEQTNPRKKGGFKQ